MSLSSVAESPRVAFVPLNQKGRDFIVGDLHGCRRDLEVVLLAAGFNPNRGDRLFSTGDLVDRGPDSMGCLKLLLQPWFFSVLGNHEQMLMRAMNSGSDDAIALSVANGGSWALGMILQRDPTLVSYVQILNKLPHVLVVGPGSPHRYNIVHSALLKSPSNMSLYLDADIDGQLANADDNAVERLIWSRTLGDQAGLVALERQAPRYRAGLSLTYCGHNPVPYPVILDSHCHIDTGSGYEGNVNVGRTDSGVPMRLTVADHNRGNQIFYTR